MDSARQRGCGHTMIQFEWWWVLFLLPLPLVARLLPARSDSRDAALQVPFLEDFDGLGGSGPEQLRSWPLFLLAIAAWAMLVLAAARPQWVGEPVRLPVSGRDLMLAVDLSGSMEARDFQLEGQPVDRLTATKAVASGFISRREGDRIGLILFGENAYLQAPLTFDRQTVKTLLQESAIGLAGKRTAIGDAIGLAVKRLRDEAGVSRVLVLLTDGANTAGEITPIRAAQLAADDDLRIYTIGVGADEMTVPSMFGQRRINPSQDLDEDTLTSIAEVTGGRYFRARDTRELEQIYALLDEMEPVETDALNFRPRRSLFYWPLALSLILTACTLLVMRGRRR